VANIVFDWFGVVCNKALIEWVRGLAVTEGIFQNVLALADLLDAGQITLVEFQRGLAALVDHPVERVHQDLMARVVVNELVVAIARRLNEKHKVSVLSNVNAEFIAEIVIKRDLASLFNPIIASSALKLIKPNPEIFRRAFEILQCRPKEVVFIDDTVGHVEVARTLGMTGIVFESADRLERDLLELGLL